jgi:hypothetical protein
LASLKNATMAFFNSLIVCRQRDRKTEGVEAQRE